MSYKREKVQIKKEAEHRLIRLATRNSNRAKRDLAKYKQTGRIEDKRAYEMHRKRSYRYRRELANRIEQRKAVSLKQIPALRREYPRPSRKRRPSKKDVGVKTVFQRTIKYREDDQTKKKVMKIGFKDRDSVEGFIELIQKGQVPIPIGISDADIFMFDAEAENYVLRRLIALYGGS